MSKFGLAPSGFGFVLALVALSVAPPARAQDGAALFAGTCAACHGERGVGVEGLAPPLDDAAFWTRLGPRAATYFAGVTTAGLSGKLTVKGVDYVGLVMPPQAQLTDQELAAIGGYLLGEVNGQSVKPTEAMIAAARAAPPTTQALRAMRGR